MKMLFVLILMSLEFASASVLKLETEIGTIHVPELKNWEIGKNMYGMPFILFSPKKNGQRSNISFTNTGESVTPEIFKISKDNDSYKKIKTKWASSVLATPISFEPYKNWKNEHNHLVHEIGFNYKHEDKNYLEKSYYIECRGKLVFVKSLRLHGNSSHEESFHELINQMDCGGK